MVNKKIVGDRITSLQVNKIIKLMLEILQIFQ